VLYEENQKAGFTFSSSRKEITGMKRNRGESSRTQKEEGSKKPALCLTAAKGILGKKGGAGPNYALAIQQ